MVIRGLFLLSLAGLSVCYVEGLAGNGNIEVLDDRLKKKFEPQVAVRCGYLNQYMLENGHWAANKEGDATCQTKKDEILNICRKAYPEKEITNIVESATNVRIENWCPDGVSSSAACSTKLWVKPYRCIVGSFQSDALLVPEGCNFSHTYDKRECKEFNFWNQTAQEACALKGLTARSFGMLVPCGIDLFSGVEYVCCPLEMEANERNIEEERSRTRYNPSSPSNNNKKTDTVSDDKADGDNWQDEYLRDAGDDQNEHEKYDLAMKKLDKHHEDRIDKMMKEWTDVAEKYRDMKKTDASGAKKVKSDLMSRVRKTLAALEEEFKDQKRQITELHQQRIDAQLNDRKRQSMDAYLDAFQTRPYKVRNFYNALEKYIRAEEKDREHTIKRYKHLLDSDPEKADDMQPTILAHLADLDQRINESLKMLNRLPESIAREVETKARDFWSRHRQEMFGPETNEELLKKHKQSATAVRTRDQIAHQRELEEKFDQLESDDDIEPDEEDVQIEPESEKFVTTTSRPVIDRDGVRFVPHDRKRPIVNVETFTTTSALPTTSFANDDDEDIEEETAIEKEETDIDKDDDIEPEQTARDQESLALRKFQEISNQAAYAKLHREVEAPYSNVQPVKSDNGSAGPILYVGLGLVGIAFFAGLLLLVVILRKRNNPREKGFSPVDTFASPEERHVANMQAHGYTNPFFNHAHQYSKA